MLCEICGKYIERGKRVMLEGSIIITCDECSKYGEVLSDVEIKGKEKGKLNLLSKKKVSDESEEEFDVKFEKELVENYGKIIRDAREKRGMKQEELARMISQPKSLISRLESGKFEPNEEIAIKIEKALGVKILIEKKSKDENLKIENRKVDDEEITLGDVAILKKRGNK